MLSPEERKATLQHFQALPKERQDILRNLTQNSCGNCEAEFNLPNVGKSHGICNRHKNDMRIELHAAAQKMGKNLPPFVPQPDNPDNKCIDLKKLSPEEIKIAVNLYALLNKAAEPITA